jgi:HD-GYP domain-containing protein (c-di-GMP phosphodiesterase class II)
MLEADRRPSAKSRPPGTPLPVAELADEARCRMEKHVAASNVVEAVSRSCRVGATRLSGNVEETVREFLNIISIDSDLLPMIVSMQQPQNEYLFDHCVNVSLLGITVATHLGLDSRKITELGIGALLQDVGMLRVPESIRLAPRTLTTGERIEVRKHTLYTLDSLQRLEGIPRAASFVGYQVHERLDGSGYPQRRSRLLIHDYAKIIAVMDIYAAMTRPRPHRPAFLPYQAMKEILFDGSRGRLDPKIIRAFLDCVSLFPIGSYVELNGGVRAKVVRANPGQHTRPVVVEVNETGESAGTVIDLSKELSARVVRALPNMPSEHQPVSLPT